MQILVSRAPASCTTLLLLALAGCGGPGGGTSSSTGSGTLRGTLLGKTFTPVDAAFYPSPIGGPEVVLSDAPGLCNEIVTKAIPANSAVLVFDLPGAVGGMTYSSVSVQFQEYDAACAPSANESGSGSVTLTAASARSVSGTFSFTLKADTITGSFVAPNCPGGPGTGAQSCR
jgi:hypothetical protein